MVEHVVMWRVDGADEAAHRAAVEEIRAMLESLPALVPNVRSLEVGENTLLGENASDLVLIVSFDDWASLKAYATHPEHLKVAARTAELTTERRSVDYEGSARRPA